MDHYIVRQDTFNADSSDELSPKNNSQQLALIDEPTDKTGSPVLQKSQQRILLHNHVDLTEPFLGESQKVKELKKRLQKAQRNHMNSFQNKEKQLMQAMIHSHRSKNDADSGASSRSNSNYSSISPQYESYDRNVNILDNNFAAKDQSYFKPTNGQKWETGNLYFDGRLQSRAKEREEVLLNFKQSNQKKTPFQKSRQNDFIQSQKEVQSMTGKAFYLYDQQHQKKRNNSRLGTSSTSSQKVVLSPRGTRDGAQARNQSTNFINSKMPVAIYGGDATKSETKSRKSSGEGTTHNESTIRMQAKNIQAEPIDQPVKKSQEDKKAVENPQSQNSNKNRNYQSMMTKSSKKERNSQLKKETQENENRAKQLSPQITKIESIVQQKPKQKKQLQKDLEKEQNKEKCDNSGVQSKKFYLSVETLQSVNVSNKRKQSQESMANDDKDSQVQLTKQGSREQDDSIDQMQINNQQSEKNIQKPSEKQTRNGTMESSDETEQPKVRLDKRLFNQNRDPDQYSCQVVPLGFQLVSDEEDVTTKKASHALKPNFQSFKEANDHESQNSIEVAGDKDEIYVEEDNSNENIKQPSARMNIRDEPSIVPEHLSEHSMSKQSIQSLPSDSQIQEKNQDQTVNAKQSISDYVSRNSESFSPVKQDEDSNHSIVLVSKQAENKTLEPCTLEPDVEEEAYEQADTSPMQQTLDPTIKQSYSNNLEPLDTNNTARNNKNVMYNSFQRNANKMHLNTSDNIQTKTQDVHAYDNSAKVNPSQYYVENNSIRTEFLSKFSQQDFRIQKENKQKQQHLNSYNEDDVLSAKSGTLAHDSKYEELEHLPHFEQNQVSIKKINEIQEDDRSSSCDKFPIMVNSETNVTQVDFFKRKKVVSQGVNTQKVSAFKMPQPSNDKTEFLKSIEEDMKDSNPVPQFKNLCKLVNEKQRETQNQHIKSVDQIQQDDQQRKKRELYHQQRQRIRNTQLAAQNILLKASGNQYLKKSVPHRVKSKDEILPTLLYEEMKNITKPLPSNLADQANYGLNLNWNSLSSLNNYHQSSSESINKDLPFKFENKRNSNMSFGSKQESNQHSTRESQLKFAMTQFGVVNLNAKKQALQPPKSSLFPQLSEKKNLSKQQKKLITFMKKKYELQRKVEMSSMVHLSNPGEWCLNHSNHSLDRMTAKQQESNSRELSVIGKNKSQKKQRNATNPKLFHTTTTKQGVGKETRMNVQSQGAGARRLGYNSKRFAQNGGTAATEPKHLRRKIRAQAAYKTETNMDLSQAELSNLNNLATSEPSAKLIQNNNDNSVEFSMKNIYKGERVSELAVRESRFNQGVRFIDTKQNSYPPSQQQSYEEIDTALLDELKFYQQLGGGDDKSDAERRFSSSFVGTGTLAGTQKLQQTPRSGQNTLTQFPELDLSPGRQEQSDEKMNFTGLSNYNNTNPMNSDEKPKGMTFHGPLDVRIHQHLRSRDIAEVIQQASNNEQIIVGITDYQSASSFGQVSTEVPLRQTTSQPHRNAQSKQKILEAIPISQMPIMMVDKSRDQQGKSQAQAQRQRNLNALLNGKGKLPTGFKTSLNPNPRKVLNFRGGNNRSMQVILSSNDKKSKV